MVTVIQSPEDMSTLADQLRSRGNRLGFVPTMGALHEGHMSLVRRSVRENDVTVVSIFVNPTQFDEQGDFDSYPRNIESDLQQCEQEEVDFAFVPDAKDIYLDDTTEARFWVEVAGDATETLCGLSRPGHFRGVMTVCAKLFNIVQPHVAYFGQKDYQQFLLMRKMVESMHFNVELALCPIVRGPQGLALSSRNNHLDKKQKAEALCLYNALEKARSAVLNGETDANKLTEVMAETILAEGADLDYAIVANPETLEDVKTVSSTVLLAVAAVVGDVRLIDNCLVEPPAPNRESL